MIFKTLAYQRLSGNFMSWFPAVVLLSMTEYVNGPYGTLESPIYVLIAFFIGSIWSIRLHAYYEAQRISKKIRINHTHRLLARSGVGLLIGIGFHWYITSMYLHGHAFGWPGWKAIGQGMACALYLGSIFWLLFDSILSWQRGLAIFYVSGWYKSSKADRVFRKLNSPILWLALKILGFVAMSYVYLESFTW